MLLYLGEVVRARPPYSRHENLPAVISLSLIAQLLPGQREVCKEEKSNACGGGAWVVASGGGGDEDRIWRLMINRLVAILQ